MKNAVIKLMCGFLILITGCTVGPDYKRPDTKIPAAFKGDKNWKIATPKDHVPKGEWWRIFNDSRLNNLEKTAFEANQNLKSAVARVMQARAAAGISKSEKFPTINLGLSAARSRSSESLGTGITSNVFRLPLDLSYEIDVWGRVRRSVEASHASFEASAADYETVLLTLQADVARTYFQIMSLDSEIQIVDQNIKLREKSLGLVQSRFKNGYTDKLDVERARTELETTKAEAASLRKTRAEYENALAVLLGKPASEFSIASAPLNIKAPYVAPGLPSELLERRPDVARAERNMAAFNARIGVAKAAFFPTISLGASAGFESSSTLFKTGNRAWSLGPGISLPIFTGGRNLADFEKAKADYDEVISNYRQTVLVAFQEVENGLSGLKFLNQQADAQNRAVKSAKNAETLSNYRYKAGSVSYMEVVDAQRTSLQTQRAATQILGQQIITTVQLVKALGGGWKP